MYFKNLPNINYATKPTQFPFKDTDYVTAKNFFKRFTLDEKLFSFAVFFKEYTISDDDRLDLLAEQYYGNAFLDWVIILTNNMIRGVYDWPLTEEELYDQVEKETDEPEKVLYYETTELKAGYKIDGVDVIALEAGIKVDEAFHNGTYRYFNGISWVTISGSLISTAVTYFEDAYRKNEAKRNIYIMKDKYVKGFVNEFKRQSQYQKSSDFITSKLKNTSLF